MEAIAITMAVAYGLVHLFKKFGAQELPAGLLAGLAASILVHIVLAVLAGDPKGVLLSFVMSTTMAVVFGFFAARKI